MIVTDFTYSEGFDPPPPKWIAEPVPDFSKFDNPELEEQKYWEEENRRWIEGHAGLTGAHYFYIQNCYLNDIDGNVFRPTWREVDETIFRWIDECIKNKESLLIFKKREVGCTALFTNLSFWFMRVFPGCKIGLTSKDQTGISNMFNSKILHSYNRFNKKVLNTTPVQLNNTKQLSSLSVALKVVDQSGVVDTRVSTLFCKETSEKPDSVNNLSGERFKYAFIDEAALHKRIDPLLGSIFPTLMRGVNRDGLLVMAGTVEPTLSNEEVGQFSALIDRSANLRIRSEMLPVWEGLITKNGWNDKEAGIRWWEANMKIYRDSGDLKGERDFRMQFPKSKEDIFELAKGGLFEDNVVDILNTTLNKLTDCPEAPYKIVPVNGKLEAIPDNKYRQPKKDGGIWIIEMPRRDLVYYISIDGVSTGKKEGEEDGSWVGATVYKGADPVTGRHYEPVAHYFERPNRVVDGYLQVINLFKFYNQYEGFEEINYETAGMADSFGTYLEQEGLYRKYSAKRKDLSGKGWVSKDKRGQAASDDNRRWQIRQANQFLTLYGSYIRSKILLTQLLMPDKHLKKKEDKDDLRDAFFIFLTSIPNFNKKEREESKPRIKTRVLVEKINGVNTYRTETWIDQPKKQGMDFADEFAEFSNQMKMKYGDRWQQAVKGEDRDKYLMLKGSPN